MRRTPLTPLDAARVAIALAADPDQAHQAEAVARLASTLPPASPADHVAGTARLLSLVADAGVSPMSPADVDEAMCLASRALGTAEQAAGITAEALGLARWVGGLRDA